MSASISTFLRFKTWPPVIWGAAGGSLSSPQWWHLLQLGCGGAAWAQLGRSFSGTMEDIGSHQVTNINGDSAGRRTVKFLTCWYLPFLLLPYFGVDQKSRLIDEGYFGKIQHDNTRANEPTNTSLQELPTSFCMQNPCETQWGKWTWGTGTRWKKLNETNFSRVWIRHHTIQK